LALDATRFEIILGSEDNGGRPPEGELPENIIQEKI
jgi:hypothetical protein